MKKKKEGTSSLSSPKPPNFSLFLSFSFSLALALIFSSSQHTKLCYLTSPRKYNTQPSFSSPAEKNANTFKIITEANLTFLLL